jgi:hypothetical protein
LLEKQVARGSAPLYGFPAALRLRRRFLHSLYHFTEVFAARSVHNDVLADAHIGHSVRVEVIDLANFGKSYTDNSWVHGGNYTVGKKEVRGKNGGK